MTKKPSSPRDYQYQKNKKPTAKKNNRRIEGQILINSHGVGFLSWQKNDELQDDIRIEKKDLNCALNKDKVVVQILYKNRTQVYGQVVKILTQAKQNFVGEIYQNGDKWWVRADDKKVYAEILVKRFLVPAKSGEKVLIKINNWRAGVPEGEVLTNLGVVGNNNTEMFSIAMEKGFNHNFPQAVEEEVKKIAENYQKNCQQELKYRLDLRQIWTCTIDPADAKDFDDALSVEKLANGNLSVGVHIADVSYFVRPNSLLDKEANQRGCSVYLVDRTIPMLPEKLSNDLCSLNPNEDKLAFSAIFEIDKNGEVIKRKFGRSIIRSNKRFTYEEAQEILNQKTGTFFTELNALNSLAKKMQQKSVDKGVINFETDEIKFKLDKNGKPIEVFLKARQDTNKMIESFMLLANREVAKFLDSFENKHQVQNSAILFRIHDQPNADRLANLSRLVAALGYELPIKNGKVKVKDLQKLMDVVEGKNEANLIKTATIRSMAKAIYSTKNIGHFGLAENFYTHFTSPIRRYPDLLIHRILAKYLISDQVDPRDIFYYEQAAKNATEREIAAAEAERDSIKYKQIELVQNYLGQTRQGVISGLTEWGLYIEDSETKAEGMVRIKDLGDDFFALDKDNYKIVGEKTRQKFRLGDKVQFQFLKADLETKTIDVKII